jgi:hypothetical protein
MDVFFEQIVPIKKKGKTILGFVGIWVLALLLCFVAFLFLGSFFIIVSAAAIYGAFVLSGKLNVEYEYIVTNTTMDVDKIINKSSRKRLLSFEIPSVTRLEKYNPAVPIKDPIIACNPEDENAYLMVCEKEGKSAQYLVFAPNAKLQSAIVKSLPKFIALSAFK